MTALAAFLISSGAAGASLSAVKNGDSAAEGFAPPNSQALITNTVIVTASGGAGPITHSWAFVSGNNVFTISNSASATVTWSVTAGLIARTAVWRDTVSDGVTSVTVDVNLFAQVS